MSNWQRPRVNVAPGCSLLPRGDALNRIIDNDLYIGLIAPARGRPAKSRCPSYPARLPSIGVFGFDRLEPVILAALVTEDPLLLIGRSGTGKTFLLNSLSEVLGVEHRHYNASLISFDDLVGFPYPEQESGTVRFLETPATVWQAESVLIDEISRCKPEHQNRLLALVHERRVRGDQCDHPPPARVFPFLHDGPPLRRCT